MLSALLLSAMIGVATVSPGSTPTPADVPASRLRELEAGTEAQIKVLEQQLAEQHGVLAGVRYLLTPAATPAPTAAPAR